MQIINLFRFCFTLGSGYFGLLFKMIHSRLFIWELSLELLNLVLIFLDSDNQFTVLLAASVEVFSDFLVFLFKRLDCTSQILGDSFGEFIIVFTEFFLRVSLSESLVLLSKIVMSKLNSGKFVKDLIMLFFKIFVLFEVSVQLIPKRPYFILRLRKFFLIFLDQFL